MTAKMLEGEDVLFKEMVGDAEITIFKNGFLTYTKFDGHGDPHRTVYSVHRCKEIRFQVKYSEEERNDAWDYSALANEVIYRMIDGELVRFNIIKEEEYQEGPWWGPITIICEERMEHNMNSREEYYSAFSMDGDVEDDEDGENWNPELSVDDPCAAWVEEEDRKEKKRKNHDVLKVAMKSLTEIQFRTISLYYSNPGITERDLAKELGVDQSTVHRNLQAGLKKLRKFF